MDLLHIVDRLEELVAAAQKMPISNRAIVDRRRLLDIIDQMRITIPHEVREATEILEHHEELRRQAAEEARTIVARAEEEARRLVEAHEVTRAARRRADEIATLAEARLEERIAEANEEIRVRIEESRTIASQQMDAADDYAREVLRRMRRQMEAFTRSIDAGLRQLETTEAPRRDASADAPTDTRPHAPDAAHRKEPRLHELPRAQSIHHPHVGDDGDHVAEAENGDRRGAGDALAVGTRYAASARDDHAGGEHASRSVHADALRGDVSQGDVPAASAANGDESGRGEHARETAAHGEPEHRQEPARIVPAQQEPQQARVPRSWMRVESDGLSAAVGSLRNGASPSAPSREPVPLRRPESQRLSPAGNEWERLRRRNGLSSGSGIVGEGEGGETAEIIDDLATPSLDDDPSRRRAEED